MKKNCYTCAMFILYSCLVVSQVANNSSILERVKQTQRHKLVAYGKVVDIMEKYTPISIEGNGAYLSYNKKNHTRFLLTEIKIEKLLLLGS